jgi:hypothetical protein
MIDRGASKMKNGDRVQIRYPEDELYGLARYFDRCFGTITGVDENGLYQVRFDEPIKVAVRDVHFDEPVAVKGDFGTVNEGSWGRKYLSYV